MEAVMTCALTLVSLPLVFPVIDAVENGAAVGSAQAYDNTMVAGTLIPLSNEISSAAVLYTPSPSSGTNYTAQGVTTSAGDALLVLSQSGSSYRCYQWAITTTGYLERRSWAPSSSTATPFVTVSAAQYPPTSTPFTLVTGTPPAIRIALELQSSSQTLTITVNATVTASNVGTSSMATQCESAPVV
jgi:hypothetical protein